MLKYWFYRCLKYYRTIALKQVEDFISELIQYDIKNSHASYSLIKNSFFALTIPYPVISLNAGTKFVRCRLHLKNEKFFCKIHEISYRKDILNITDFGRANEPVQTIFYASDRQEISFIETSNIIRNNNPLPFETITMGVWEVQQPIKIAGILSNDIIKGQNEIIEKLTSQFISLVKQDDIKKIEPLLKFFDYISRYYTQDVKNDCSKYKVSCAFPNYIFSNNWIDERNKQMNNVDAIVYPSTLDLKGINIAIHPRVINQGKLKLVSVRKSTMKKIEKLIYSQEDIVDSKSIDYINGDIIW